jgi:hypothetical protein
VLCTNFKAAKEDRIVFFTDGVAQSGLGSDRYPVGWGEGSVNNFIIEALKEEHDISAVKLASMVINRANQNDDFNPKDDISCAVIYFREPRKLMICSGPPWIR